MKTHLSPSHWFALVFLILGVLPCFSQAQEVELVLRLRGQASVEDLARSVTDPESPRYRDFYTPEEIRSLVGPAELEYQQTLDALARRGLQVVSEDKAHLFLTVQGEAAGVEQVFRTRLQFEGLNHELHRPVQSPSIPRDLALVQSISGLDNTRQSRPLYRLKGTALPSSDELREPIPGYDPGTIQKDYGFRQIYQSGLTAQGQHIAVATYGMYYEKDVASYWKSMRVIPAPVLDSVFFNGKPPIDESVCAETELDAEFSGMIAPGASVHVFPSAHNDDPGEIQLFTAILDDNRAKVINYSWGDCEANVTAQHFADMNQVFARAVAQGVNVMVAAGDWGSFGCPSVGRGKPDKMNADWPAANPYVVAVGGTTLNGYEGPSFEVAWDGTGGGVSVVFPRPSWQSVESGVPASFQKRAFPDVAFNADPNSGEPAYVHYQGEQRWIQIGGTSIAAPQWSGFLALVGAARGNSPSLGFLNPIIYSMSAADRANTFRDTVKGSNGAYKAGAGWDATTGFGSMRAAALLEFLRGH